MIRIFLLRHGEVRSHRGDVPITTDAEHQAFEVGRALGRAETGEILILSGETRRAMDTARHLSLGVIDAGGRVSGPRVAMALRNPDLYVAGTRVNMVSSAEALAEQVGGLDAGDVDALDFFPEFFASPDRIGWWLGHRSPPGEDAASLASRIRSFVSSLADPVPDPPQVVVAVTHSPLVRAAALDFLGQDLGEPPWISGLLLTVDEGRMISTERFEPEQA